MVKTKVAVRLTAREAVTAPLDKPAATQAAPAPWYWWVSKLDGKRVCAQHMPASGWERAEGPFTQAGCQTQQPRALLGGPGR